MILKEIQLKNIRSYAELAPFQFPGGTSLFYGDVGSGKSSLLYAIEFTLFGIGELEGSDMLRNGATEGFVSLAFEEDGKNYIVYRKLRRRGTAIRQIEGTISENGELHSYDSITEMKSTILEILKLNEKPQPRTSSVIYRYGIFTPQEEIKGIMEASSESRLETLRRAFRLHRYAIVRDNAQALCNHLEKVEMKILEKQAEGLEGKKSQRDSLAEQIEMNNDEVVRLQKKVAEINAALTILQEKKKEEEAALDEIKGFKAQIPLIEEQCKGDKQTISQLREGLTSLEQKKSELANELKELQSLPKPTEKSEEELEADLQRIEERRNALADQRGANKKTLSNYEMLIDKKICPTCERPIEDPSVYKEKCDKMRQEVADSITAEKEMEEQKRSLNSLLQELRRYHEQIAKLPWLQEEIKAKTKDIEEKASEIQQVEGRLSESQGKLRQMQELVKPSEQLLKAFDQTKQQIESEVGLAHEKDKEIALLRQKNDGLEEQKRQLAQEIRKGEAALARIDAYQEVIKYLEQYFIPTMERIETIVLQAIHEEFNDAFQKYFSMIIGFTEIEAEIDEDFSVLVRQGGYEMPYRSLSGGERTSLALAYRLALNQIIRKLAKLEKGLLVLDEPTEGLSYAQVLNLREVFDDLDCNQIILISHESQFLGFSDNAFRVAKVDHVSTITPF